MTWHDGIIPDHLNPAVYQYNTTMDNFSPPRSYGYGEIIAHDTIHGEKGYVVQTRGFKNAEKNMYLLDFEDDKVLCYVAAYKEGEFIHLLPMNHRSYMGPRTMYTIHVLGNNKNNKGN
jgi:hypothetical protein